MGNHRWPVNSPHKGPVTRKRFPFHDVIMKSCDFQWNSFIESSSVPGQTSSKPSRSLHQTDSPTRDRTQKIRTPWVGAYPERAMMTSSNGNIEIFFDLCLKKGWVNNWDVGDLRRHHAHYDVTVMIDTRVISWRAGYGIKSHTGVFVQ